MKKETNSIKHCISIDNEKVKAVIEIRLNDECKNGHEDFSITADFWEPGKTKSERNYIMGGCCHEEIVKLFPELKIFVDLHLNDFRGYPMYYIENGFYNLKNMKKEEFLDNMKVKEKDYETLLAAQTNEEFGYLLLSKLKNHKVWESLAKKAIKMLEEMSQSKFKSSATRLYDIDKYLKASFPENYFNPEEVNHRKKAAFLMKQNKKIEELVSNYSKKCKEAQNEHKIKIQLMKLGFLDLGNTRHYFDKSEFHINVKRMVIGENYKIKNSEFSYTFTEDDYFKMNIELPEGYKLIFNNYNL